MTSYQSGKALKLNATFRDLDNTLFDPTINSVEILAPDKSVIETFENDEWTKVSTGVYYIIYNLPEDYPYVYHKWNVEDGNSITDTEKQKIDIIYSD